MASRGQTLTITYVAWDTDANAGKTGDVANHTLRWVKDGTSAAPDNSPSEVDATNAPGIYKITLTGTECTCWVGVLAGKSSTADVVVMPVTIAFEQLPTAAPDAAGGLPISDAGELDLDTLLARLDAAVSSRSTHDADAVVTALGTGSTLTDCATAAGFSTLDAAGVRTAIGLAEANLDTQLGTLSTHDADAVVTALGTGATLTDCATAAGFSTLDAAGVRTAIGLAEANLDTQLGTLSTHDADAVVTALGTGATLTDCATAAGFATAENLTVVAGYLDTEIADIKTVTDKLGDTLEDDGGTYRFTSNALEEGPAGELTADAIDTTLTASHGAGSWQTGGDTGSGANTVTLTVDDGADAVVGAKVRVTCGALSYLDTTDDSGEVSFSLDDGTWAVAITRPGYSFTPTTLAVSGDTEETYSMTATVVPASEPGQVVGYLYCYDEEGQAEEGAEIQLQQTRAAEATGVAYDATVRTETSDATGLVEFAGLFAGATYRMRRGSATRWENVSIAADAADPYALASIVGPG